MTAKKKAKKKNGRGGDREGSGRPLGAVGAVRRTAIEMASDGGGHPFEYLLQISRDVEEDPDRRFAAAQACVPFVLPRLATTEITVKTEVETMTPQQRVAYAAELTKRIQNENPNIELPQLTVIEGEYERVG